MIQSNDTVSELRLRRQGHFWVGVQRIPRDEETIATGAMFVRYQLSAMDRRDEAIVMVHGGGSQGLDYMGTPDGRPGWAEFFLRRGFDVYVVDRPGMGRSPAAGAAALAPAASYQAMDALMMHPKNGPIDYPQARLHTQWPEGADVEDQFMAGVGALPATLASAQEDMQRCGAALLDRIGKAIVMTHSMGGPFGWLVADSRPDLVRAIIAVEPAGPPFGEVAGHGPLDWGLTAIPMTYEPAASAPSDLRTEIRDPGRPGLQPCLWQKSPARQLPRLAGIPICVVTGEASWMAANNHGVVDYLTQAGAQAEHVRLEEHSVHGNGHLMMMERNSDAIAALICEWIDRKLSR